ncbi:hypothetical protein [Streptomyces xanthophaeus]|uniref:hypothetical protein n=1 Tax=Streptomyces xanthophaeus TaxID=67385 RepID=UPI00233F475F|nr:hypothetical protein [Streptomyces xanthophaeus]
MAEIDLLGPEADWQRSAPPFQMVGIQASRLLPSWLLREAGFHRVAGERVRRPHHHLGDPPVAGRLDGRPGRVDTLAGSKI